MSNSSASSMSMDDEEEVYEEENSTWYGIEILPAEDLSSEDIEDTEESKASAASSLVFLSGLGSGGSAITSSTSNSTSASSTSSSAASGDGVPVIDPFSSVFDHLSRYLSNTAESVLTSYEKTIITNYLGEYARSNAGSSRPLALSSLIVRKKGLENDIDYYEREIKGVIDSQASNAKKAKGQAKQMQIAAGKARTEAAIRAIAGDEDKYAFRDFPLEYIVKSLRTTNDDLFKDAQGFTSSPFYKYCAYNLVGDDTRSSSKKTKFPYEPHTVPYLSSSNSAIAELTNPYKIFFTTLGISHSIYDTILGGTFGLTDIYSPASAFDSAPETNNTGISGLESFLTLQTLDLQKHGFTKDKYLLNIQFTTPRKITYTITHEGKVFLTINILIPSDGTNKSVSSSDKINYIKGNAAKEEYFRRFITTSYNNETDVPTGMKYLLCKALGDGLKAKMSKFYSILGFPNTVLTRDRNNALRCTYDRCNVLLATGREAHQRLHFFPKPSLYTTAATAKEAARTEGFRQRVDSTWEVVGGKRRSRSLKRNRQKGGAYTDNKELMHDAYIAFLLADVGNYCIILREYLSKSGADEKVNEILDFLSSKEYSTYLSQIDKTKSTDLFLKEISQWLPDRVIYRSDDMETFSDTISESIPITYSLHSVKKHFPMQGDTIEILGKRLNNNFYEGDLTVTINKNPDFKAILSVAAEKYNDITAKRLLDQGGVTEQTRDMFIKMLHELQIKNNTIPFQSILKAIFKEIIPDTIEASRLYNLFSLYVTFHGYHVLDYQVIQKFVSLVNLNKGIFPSGFDGMKIIVVGVENAKVVINGENTVSSSTTAGSYEVEEDPEVQRYREQLATASGLGSKLPSMIAAGAAGGRRTKRRDRRGQKKRKTRHLTKKERNW
jgi:hypothetical protein